MSKLLITGCTDALLWYADKIGESFEALRVRDGQYLVRASDGHTNIVHLEDGELVRPTKYSTAELYGVSLRTLHGEIPYFKARLEMLGANLSVENARHHTIRDSHLITKIRDAQSFYRERIKEIES